MNIPNNSVLGNLPSFAQIEYMKYEQIANIPEPYKQF